ncbi:hypothetical protein NIES4103_17360 [Nostoc sp. NIES-4103]|nr:hypothetical protein NIES4103_17360 [Nostoc sp. NIES-4103]
MTIKKVLGIQRCEVAPILDATSSTSGATAAPALPRAFAASWRH